MDAMNDYLKMIFPFDILMVVDGRLSAVEKWELFCRFCYLPHSRGRRSSRQKYLGGDAAPPYLCSSRGNEVHLFRFVLTLNRNLDLNPAQKKRLRLRARLRLGETLVWRPPGRRWCGTPEFLFLNLSFPV
jgi:hypothetical protein